MDSGSLDANESHSDTLQDNFHGRGEFQGKMIICPNCMERVPTTLYCLKCGYPLYNISQEEDEEVTVEVARKPFSFEREPDYVADLDLPEPEDVEFEREPDLAEAEDVEIEVDEEPFETEKEAPQEEEPLLELPVATLPTEEEVSGLEPTVEEAPQEEEPLLELPVATLTTEEEVSGLEPTVEEAPQEEEPLLELPVATLTTEEEVSGLEPTVEEAPVEAEITEMEEDFEPDPALRELLKDLLNSLSLKLWSVSLLVEGRVKEDHFVKLFEGYRERFEHYKRKRDELLERTRYLEPLEMALNEAKVGLGELEVRRTIGDLQEGEFEAKAPAYRWDIRHYEAEIAMKRKEIAFLDDLIHVMPGDEISKMKTITERAISELNELEREGRVGSGTAANVRASLEDALKILGDF